MIRQRHIFKYFFIREVKSDYLANLLGLSWLFVQPVVLLLMYWFVFEKIFQARIPEKLNLDFIVYLAIGFWPWLAFSESIVKSIPAVMKNSELIGKNKIDFKIPVLASISATFLVNCLSFFLVLFLLTLYYDFLSIEKVVLLFIPLFQLYVLSLAIGLILSATQVFVKDTLQVVGTLITLLFYFTPIIYSELAIPEQYINYLKYNPLYTPFSFIHNIFIVQELLPWRQMIYLSLFIILFLVISIKYFNRLSAHFEDYK